MDQRLVVKARDGDPEAFRKLAIASHPRLFNAAFGILRDRGLAEDATQRALVGVWRYLRGLRDGSRWDVDGVIIPGPMPEPPASVVPPDTE